MPVKRRYNKYKRKGTGKKTLYKSRFSGAVSRRRRSYSRRRRRAKAYSILNLAPKHGRMARLVYVETGLQLQPIVSAIGHYTFAANSIFDPNVTGIGHQPRLHDDFQALYNRYCVVGAKIEVTFRQTTNTIDNAAVRVGINKRQSDQTTFAGTTTAVQVLEQEYLKTYNMNAFDHSTSMKTCVARWSLKNDAKGKGRIEDSLFSAQFGANPATLWYFEPCVLHVGTGTATPAPVIFDVKISYIVWLHDPSIEVID